MAVGTRRVVAFRLWAGEPAEVLAGWAVQDSPPGAAVAALVARARDVPAAWLDGAVALYNPRTATAVVPRAQAAAFATAFLPPDEDATRGIAGQALADWDGTATEAMELAVAAVSDALDGRTLSRDDLHAALRERLPDGLLPWCAGCRSHHARRGLLVLAGLHGRLCVAGRAGRQPAFARTDQLHGWDPPPREEAGAALVRRYLRSYGPSTRRHFAAWAGLGTRHAAELWASVEEELAAVGGAASVLADDVDALAGAEPPAGVRLLAPGDPLLLARDREVLASDPAIAKKLAPGPGAPGLVLADGEPAALWRARKQGHTLAVTLDPLPRTSPGAARTASTGMRALVDAVRREAERLAPHRGCTGATASLPG